MFTKARTRSREFDNEWQASKTPSQNLRTLFQNYIPSHPFHNKHAENIQKAAEIVGVMNHGIYNFRDKLSYSLTIDAEKELLMVYTFLRACIGEGNFEGFQIANVFGEFNKRLSYALVRLEAQDSSLKARGDELLARGGLWRGREMGGISSQEKNAPLFKVAEIKSFRHS